jgi:hypothetical protein
MNMAAGVCNNWKDVSGHGKIGSKHEFFIIEGYNDLPGLWPRILMMERQQGKNEAFIELMRIKRQVAARKNR